MTNVVKHAYHCQPGHEVRVAVSIYPDRISFQIRDTGSRMRSLAQEPREFDHHNLPSVPETGMGLQIIQQIMDEVDYQTVDGINILTLQKYFKKTSSA
ncbi:MAG: ATP-binding protein [Desulfobacca sp.]|nr:ATP-binding protein [Desulfobacca sp.]